MQPALERFVRRVLPHVEAVRPVEKSATAIEVDLQRRCLNLDRLAHACDATHTSQCTSEVFVRPGDKQYAHRKVAQLWYGSEHPAEPVVAAVPAPKVFQLYAAGKSARHSRAVTVASALKNDQRGPLRQGLILRQRPVSCDRP